MHIQENLLTLIKLAGDREFINIVVKVVDNFSWLEKFMLAERDKRYRPILLCCNDYTGQNYTQQIEINLRGAYLICIYILPNSI